MQSDIQFQSIKGFGVWEHITLIHHWNAAWCLEVKVVITQRSILLSYNLFPTNNKCLFESYEI